MRRSFRLFARPSDRLCLSLFSVTTIYTSKGDHGMTSFRKALRTVPARSAGFTLIEVMIVVVVVAILAAIAYPSYQEHLRKGRRATAQAFMMEMANKQQQFLIDTRGYALGAGAVAALGLTVAASVSDYYAINVDPAVPTTPPSFNITATPIAGGPQAADGVLELNHLGAKVRNGTPGW
jgi:type IV pilus assembly protein PilE